MTLQEIKSEELMERLEYKNACIIGKLLDGQKFQGTAYIVERLKNGTNNLQIL